MSAGPFSVVRSARRGGLVLWYAVVAGIGWWMVHLTAEAALVQLACNRGHRVVVVMHLITAATALPTILAIWMCSALIRSPEAARAPGNRTRFLGWFGLMTGVISLELILLEGAYIAILNPCARP